MRVRLRFTEFGKIRFIGHRDMARIFERAVRRAGLPMAYSEGFSPRPKFHYGLALSTGHESHAEFLDIDLTEWIEPEVVMAGLNAGLPEGLTVVGAVEVASNAKALQEVVVSVTWRYDLAECDPTALSERVSAMMNADQIELEIERKGKTITEDVRPNIAALDVTPDESGSTVLVARLNTKPRSLRPMELLEAIGQTPEPSRITRMEQWIDTGGELSSPLDAPATSPGVPVA